MENKAHSNPSNENHKDWISEMPDEILIMILSRLTLKEAGRTSILSHKWKNLWKFFTGNMDFDAYETMVLALGHREKVCIGARKLKHWVNQVLNSHQGQTVQGLRFAYELTIDSTEDINRWIDFAMIKKVQRLELDFSPAPVDIQDVEVMYIFPDWILERISPLHHASSFDTLTSLSFKCVNVTEQVLTYFLSNCPLLEHLCVHEAPSIRHLRISGHPRLKLNKLHITHCKNLEDLKISAAELVVFEYAGPVIYMSVENAPLLSSLILGGDYCTNIIHNRFEGLSIYICQLERLVLNTIHMVLGGFMCFPRRFPEFSNLKELEINFKAYKDQCILFLSSFVRASPRLCKFALKYRICPSSLGVRSQRHVELLKRLEEIHRWTLPNCPHENLKVVEFRGWVGLKPDFELALRLPEICASLEKMIIDPRKTESRMDLHPRWHQCPQEIEDARERARELATNLPQGVDLIIRLHLGFPHPKSTLSNG